MGVFPTVSAAVALLRQVNGRIPSDRDRAFEWFSFLRFGVGLPDGAGLWLRRFGSEPHGFLSRLLPSQLFFFTRTNRVVVFAADGELCLRRKA